MTAAAIARTRFHIFGSWNASGLERFVHVSGDGFLHFVHLLLRIDEAFRHRIAEKSFAMGFELFDFSIGQLRALLLFVLEIFAAFRERFVLFLRLFIRVEGIDALAQRFNLRLV